MSPKYIATAVIGIAVAAVVGSASFAAQRSSDESDVASPTTVAAPHELPEADPQPGSEVPSATTTTTAVTTTVAPSTASDIQPTAPAPGVHLPTTDEVGRERASDEEVLATYGAFDVRKLVAAGVADDGHEWWTTTWNRQLSSGVTIWCLGSPSGAACWDDDFLPTSAPAVVLGIGGWPPDLKVLVDPEATVTSVEIDGAVISFDQVPLDVPSGRSIVAIPLPSNSADVAVRFAADGHEGTLEIPYVSDLEDAELNTLATRDQVSLDYGPLPGMVVGDTTTSD